MRSNFGRCLETTLRYEGGYSNHPKDPGGVTLEGVIQRVYDDYRLRQGRQPKALTPDMRHTPEWVAERNDIYRRNYWNKVGGDALPVGLDLAVFDFGVNSGPARANSYLRALPAGLGVIATIKAYCDKRLSFLTHLKTWATFGGGWGRRVASVKALGVRWALEAEGKSADEVHDDLQREADSASQARNNASTAAGGAGAAGGGAPTQIPVDSFDWSTILMFSTFSIIVLAIIGYFAYKAYLKHTEAKAFRAVAVEAKDEAPAEKKPGE